MRARRGPGDAGGLLFEAGVFEFQLFLPPLENLLQAELEPLHGLACGALACGAPAGTAGLAARARAS
jgi:hypothetical protein